MARGFFGWLQRRMVSDMGTEPPGPQPIILPEGYTQVQYLHFNGSGYIDLGLAGDEATDAVEVDCQLDSAVAQTRIVSSATNTRYFQLYVNGSLHLGYNHNTTWKGLNSVTFDTDRHVVGVDYKEKKVRYDSSEETFSGSSTKVPSSNTTIAGKYTSNPSFTGKIYGAKFWNNGVLTIDLVMCRNEENVPYVYNIISETFLTLSGSGTTVGPDV